MTLKTYIQKINTTFLHNIQPTLLFESWIIGTILGFFFLLIGGWMLFWQTYNTKILPAVSIQNINVGGLTKKEAKKVLTKSFTIQPDNTIIFTTYSNSDLKTNTENIEKTNDLEKKDIHQSTQQVTFQDLEVEYDFQSAVETAYSVGRQGSIDTRFTTLATLFFQPQEIPLSIVHNQASTEELLQDIVLKTYIEPINPVVSLNPQNSNQKIEVKKGSYGREIDIHTVNTAITELLNNEFTNTHQTTTNTTQSFELSLNPAILKTGIELSNDEIETVQKTLTNLAQTDLMFVLTEDIAKENQDLFHLYEELTMISSWNQNYRFNADQNRLEWKISSEKLLSLIDFVNKEHTKKNASFDIGIPNALLTVHSAKSILQPWADQLFRDPQEPVFEYNSEYKKVEAFTPPKNGLSLNIDTASDQISSFIKQTIRENGNNTHSTKNNNHTTNTKNYTVVPLPLEITFPEKSLESLNDLGIIEPIGKGMSMYRGSPSNRAYNVSLTAHRINNYLVAPGEEFSFNRALGPVSASTGFKSAYVIKSGRTELGDGGGVCQASTTIFRAALNAGLDITRRLQHSYRVGYYEQGFKPGLDATVYSGDIDLRFINDTDHYILIHNTIDATNLIMTTKIFGTSDGRNTQITAHEVWGSRPAPPPEYFPDPNLAPGQVIQVDWAVDGIKTRVVNEIRDKDGELIREDIYYSNYIPWSAKYMVGT